MFKKAILINFGLVALAAAFAVSSAVDLREAEKLRLARDSELLTEMAHKYVDPANTWNQSADPNYWAIAGRIIQSIDFMRQNIIGRALEYQESELKYAFGSCETLSEHALAALRDVLKMGDMMSAKLGEDILTIEKLIKRKPGQP